MTLDDDIIATLRRVLEARRCALEARRELERAEARLDILARLRESRGVETADNGATLASSPPP
jgi:hypothetical protein